MFAPGEMHDAIDPFEFCFFDFAALGDPFHFMLVTGIATHGCQDRVPRGFQCFGQSRADQTAGTGDENLLRLSWSHLTVAGLIEVGCRRPRYSDLSHRILTAMLAIS